MNLECLTNSLLVGLMPPATLTGCSHPTPRTNLRQWYPTELPWALAVMRASRSSTLQALRPNPPRVLISKAENLAPADVQQTQMPRPIRTIIEVDCVFPTHSTVTKFASGSATATGELPPNRPAETAYY